MKVRRSEIQSAITSKGQATIPKEIRDQLNLKAGDRVKWFVHPAGHIVVYPMRAITALRGILHDPSRAPVTIEEMNEGIAAGAVKRWDRFINQG